MLVFAKKKLILANNIPPKKIERKWEGLVLAKIRQFLGNDILFKKIEGEWAGLGLHKLNLRLILYKTRNSMFPSQIKPFGTISNFLEILGIFESFSRISQLFDDKSSKIF